MKKPNFETLWVEFFPKILSSFWGWERSPCFGEQVKVMISAILVDLSSPARSLVKAGWGFGQPKFPSFKWFRCPIKTEGIFRFWLVGILMIIWDLWAPSCPLLLPADPLSSSLLLFEFWLKDSDVFELKEELWFDELSLAFCSGYKTAALAAACCFFGFLWILRSSCGWSLMKWGWLNTILRSSWVIYWNP